MMLLIVTHQPPTSQIRFKKQKASLAVQEVTSSEIKDVSSMKLTKPMISQNSQEHESGQICAALLQYCALPFACKAIALVTVLPKS